MENKMYPISEIFVSPQGEGVFCGVAMAFVRLSGCTVGKPYPKNRYTYAATDSNDNQNAVLPVYTEQCTLYDGRKFSCDTDYRVKERLTVDQILLRIPDDVEHVCITGGEPMMHDLSTLITYLWAKQKKVHIETSGTINNVIPSKDVWVTVSPKYGVYLDMLKRADEIKILVDGQFNPTEKIRAYYHELMQAVSLLDIAESKPVYLQPVNLEFEISRENLRLCMEWQKKFPCFRLSLQLHKVLSQEINELVR
jgi:7-carboxy-7-deazaguanine synthase